MTLSEITELINGAPGMDESLFAAARSVREQFFGNKIVLRGVIEITNRCRVNCEFCPMRRDNTKLTDRFMLGSEDIVGAARAVKAAGINIVFLQGGEVPQTTKLCVRAIPEILQEYSGAAEVLLNLGSKTRGEYEQLKAAGARSYILKHETTNPDAYQALKHESLSSRLKCFRDLLALGFNVGTGIIVGLPGQSHESLAKDIKLLTEEPVRMLSVSPFVAAPNTPLAASPEGPIDRTLRSIAVLRLIRPDVLIPAVSALQVSREGGQGAGLDAGANVLTANFTPADKIGSYQIYGSQRYVAQLDHINRLLASKGLEGSGSCWV